MGILDNLKGKLTGAVDSQGEKIGEGADKAGEIISQRTGGQYDSQIDTGVDKAKDALDGLDGQDDDIS